MIAVKENRQYTITEVDAKSFLGSGYDVYKNDGTLFAYGKGKTVPYEKHMTEVKELEDRIKELEAEIKELKAKPKKAKKED